MDTLKVIVLGTTHHNTLGVIRALGESGKHLRCTLLLYGEEDSYLTQSKYVSRTIFVAKAEDIAKTLLENVSEGKQVVIAVTDEAVHQLDLNADSLKPYFHFFSTLKPGVLTTYMDKGMQDVLAEKVGLDVPRDYTNEKIEYPCILKPLASISGGKRVLICHNIDEYNQQISHYPKTQFQIQQFIEKEQEIVLVGMSLGGVVYVPAFVEKHREICGGTTYSTVHEITELDDSVVERSQRLIKEIGYEGLFGIELILSKGKYFFIEVNLRTDATCYAVAVAGVNLPLAYVNAKYGEDVSLLLNRPIHKIDSIVEFRDFEFVIKRKISLLKWTKQRNNCKCRYFYNPLDIKPYQINRKILRERLLKAALEKILQLFRIKR